MQYNNLKDSGNRQSFDTGAVRDIQENKGRFDLIPPTALKRIARHYENGAKKYAERNWEKGIPTNRCLDSAIRHLFCYLDGDNEEDNLAAACWNIMAIMTYEEKLPEMQTIPTRPDFIENDVEEEVTTYNPLVEAWKSVIEAISSFAKSLHEGMVKAKEEEISDDR